jgi:hypothetical protein
VYSRRKRRTMKNIVMITTAVAVLALTGCDREEEACLDSSEVADTAEASDTAEATDSDDCSDDVAEE